MIIEFFGPPGVGKTTFARLVAARLRKRYSNVKLILSYRPSEHPLATNTEAAAHVHIPPTLRRLTRPMVECLAATGHSGDAAEAHAIAELMRLVTTRNVVQSLRLRQYLLRLCRSWFAAEDTDDITLFDQAFVQAICSSVQLAKAADPQKIAQVLDGIPEAGLLVRLDAPEEILRTRLTERRGQQGRIERLLDRWANSETLWVYEQVYELIRARGGFVISVNSTNRNSLAEGIDRVETIVTGRMGIPGPGSDSQQDGVGCQ